MDSHLGEESILQLLKDLDQNHIIEEYGKSSSEDKQAFLEQIKVLESSYPGGIKEYCQRAKDLLEKSKNNENPYKLYTPSVPEGVNIEFGNEEFHKYESIGLEQIEYAGFTLVAGGLGERLGYDDIKIGIPVTLTTGDQYIKTYCEFLLAYEERIRLAKPNLPESFMVPLCIMTSDDTYSKTVKLLSDNNNFGMRGNQITIVKQEKVPAILNNKAHMALIPGKLLVETKPHGHGDVHTVLHQNGVIDAWNKLGKRWVVFFQDTNSLIFRALPSAIGVSHVNQYIVNSVTVPRVPGEAVGAICKLTHNETKESHTINVEYNFLDSLLKEKWNPLGDIKNDKGLSYFPGNINVLVFELTSYLDTLNKTRGLMPEFVNPKYADAEKTSFKSPTRLECLMQDYPQLIPGQKIGFTMYERIFSYSPCKNNLTDAVNKFKNGLPPDCGFSIELDIFESNCKLLELAGVIEYVNRDNHPSIEISGVKVPFPYPKVVLKPSFGVILKEIQGRFAGKVQISSDGTLICEGRNGQIAETKIGNETQHFIDGQMNKLNPTVYVPLNGGEGLNYEKMRGFKAVR